MRLALQIPPASLGNLLSEYETGFSAPLLTVGCGEFLAEILDGEAQALLGGYLG